MSKKPQNLAPVPSDSLFYAAPDGTVKVQVLFRAETAWMTQKALDELFGVKVPVIARHLKNIFVSGELEEEAVVSILETTAADGKHYQTRFYNLDAIIAVGYRVNSYQATQFRIWATRTLREFLIRGFVLGDERLKKGKTVFSKDYLDLAENRAQRNTLMKMKDWAGFLNQFLELSNYPILVDKGRVSALEAKLKAEAEYDAYRKQQDTEYLSDFDRVVEETQRLQITGKPKALTSGRKGIKP
jgi:hypothetical protein